MFNKKKKEKFKLRKHSTETIQENVNNTPDGTQPKIVISEQPKGPPKIKTKFFDGSIAIIERDYEKFLDDDSIMGIVDTSLSNKKGLNQHENSFLFIVTYIGF